MMNLRRQTAIRDNNEEDTNKTPEVYVNNNNFGSSHKEEGWRDFFKFIKESRLRSRSKATKKINMKNYVRLI